MSQLARARAHLAARLEPRCSSRPARSGAHVPSRPRRPRSAPSRSCSSRTPLAFRLDFEVENRLGRPDAARPRPDAVRPADRLGAARSGGGDRARGLGGRAARAAARRTGSSSTSGTRGTPSGPALVLGLDGEGPPSLSQWPLYLAALLAQFAFDFASSAVSEWAVLGVPPKMQLRAMAWVYAIDAGLASVGLAVAFATVDSPFARGARLAAGRRCSPSSRGNAGCGSTPSSSCATPTAEPCSCSAKWSRPTTPTRAPTAATWSTCRSLVADELGIGARERRDIEFAALLHDVGKVRIPNEIINKPGALTPEERAIIETHTIEGERMLHRVGGLLGDIGRIVRSCHERWDGTGYPDGLADEQIPRAARIVALLRRVQRDDDRPFVPQGPVVVGRDRGAPAQPRHAVRPAGRGRAARDRDANFARRLERADLADLARADASPLSASRASRRVGGPTLAAASPMRSAAPSPSCSLLQAGGSAVRPATHRPSGAPLTSCSLQLGIVRREVVAVPWQFSAWLPGIVRAWLLPTARASRRPGRSSTRGSSPRSSGSTTHAARSPRPTGAWGSSRATWSSSGRATNRCARSSTAPGGAGATPRPETSSST